ncbi:MAG TPA: PHB depolymerase family esterase [Ohtaekwangia sp.]|nr:PHB depolymerase family esterase [Ohtaekwangia sp.]
MNKTSLFLLCLVTFICYQCNSQGNHVKETLVIEGRERVFYFKEPAAALSEPSLVFILHGSGGNAGNVIEKSKQLSAIADGENVVLVYPEGYQQYWNECRKAANSKANLENINEEAFFDAMIAFFKKKYAIDDRNVFAIGTSGGGHMCYKLALTMPRKFAAITALIANLPDTDNMDCTESKIALPVMVVNGTADPLNPYNGGMMRSGDFIMGNVRSTDRTIEYWTTLAGHTAPPVKETLPDADPGDGKTIERYTYRSPGKPDVVLLKVIGGKHDLPGDADVYLEAWNFFKRQQRVP